MCNSKSLFKTITGGALALGLLFTSNVNAQDAEAAPAEDKKLDMNVTLNSDIFFGFYPFFNGAYAVSDKVDFTFYGILWSGGGPGASWGNWTEFGMGIGIPVNDAIYVNPQIGLLSGGLTSGLGTPVLAEGIVPNLTIGIDDEAIEGEIYAGYYNGLDHGNPVTNNYLHYWANTGYKFNSIVSAGVHFEHLRFTGGKNYASDAAYDYYQVVGPYLQFSKPDGSAFTRFSSGWDLRSDEQVTKSGYSQPSFFKLTVGMSI